MANCYVAKPGGRQVIVAGGGVAGLMAAHRLVQRGYNVTLLESNEFLGGKLGAHRDDARATVDCSRPAAEQSGQVPHACAPCIAAGVCQAGGVTRCKGDWHEHCYHMYLNWYHNFWQVMDEANALGNFMPMPVTNNIHRDQLGKAVAVANVGSLWTWRQNLFSGLGSPPDLLLWAQAMADLVGSPPRKQDWLEKTSIMSFMTSRPYITEQAMAGTYRTTAQAFAAPSYLSSSRSYRALLSYGARLPEPQMWLATADTETAIFTPWLVHLAQIASSFSYSAGDDFHNTEPFEKARQAADAKRAHHGHAAHPSGSLTIRMMTGVAGLSLNPDSGRITALQTVPFERTDALGGTKPVADAAVETMAVDGDVILAVPLPILTNLITPAIAQWAPNLANVRNLRCEPMISLDLYFNRKLDGLPQGITVLLDSPYEMSFLDNSQTWCKAEPGDAPGHTVLNVIASKADTIVGYQAAETLDIMLDELARYIAFGRADIQHCRTHLQTNVGEALFVNEVGSWEMRPAAGCGIRNLFIAGDYCQTPVDVVTIEGAAVSGLMAAEALRRRHGHGTPIPIRTPDVYPALMMGAFANSQRPIAAAVSGTLSAVNAAVTAAYSAVFPTG